jgi:hypothetical protein
MMANSSCRNMVAKKVITIGLSAKSVADSLISRFFRTYAEVKADTVEKRAQRAVISNA